MQQSVFSLGEFINVAVFQFIFKLTFLFMNQSIIIIGKAYDKIAARTTGSKFLFRISLSQIETN